MGEIGIDQNERSPPDISINTLCHTNGVELGIEEIWGTLIGSKPDLGCELFRQEVKAQV